jgi:hypothetical protein
LQVDGLPSVSKLVHLVVVYCSGAGKGVFGNGRSPSYRLSGIMVASEIVLGVVAVIECCILWLG